MGHEAAVSFHHTVDAQSLNSLYTNTLVICQVCSCSFEQENFCASCFEGEEFEQLLQGDSGYHSLTDPPSSQTYTILFDRHSHWITCNS